MARVLKPFRCKVTKKRYGAGDTYDGDRTEDLQALGYVRAAKDDSDTQPEWPEHVGGGNYELSNGEKVKGKDKALAAQAELDGG